ncbi:histidine phosphatase family protein [Dongia sp.]|uniref:histidine phosphatase family protein n=1 Tax=Dongia sp. TaxID=1977262 RepID=UPI0035AD88F0
MTGALPCRFIFLRHGQTDWNATGRVMGQKDIPLNDTGRAQAEAASERLLTLPVTSIWCSPLIRCRATAAPLLARRPDLPDIVLDDLQERNWGVFEGHNEDRRPPRRETPPGGESMAAFTARIMAALSTINDCALPLVISHSGVLRVILGHLGLERDRVAVPNATPLMVVPGARPQARIQHLATE